MICETTVELNSSFGMITTISGFGGGPAGGLSRLGWNGPRLEKEWRLV